MRKRKGVALPTAIFLCSFMLLVTISIGTILLMASISNKIINNKANYDIVFARANNQFINERPIDDETFKWEIYEKEDDYSIKALAAYNKADQLRFYSIYDFTIGKTLAYQTSNFYITYVDEDMYLGGIVKVSRS